MQGLTGATATQQRQMEALTTILDHISVIERRFLLRSGQSEMNNAFDHFMLNEQTQECDAKKLRLREGDDKIQSPKFQ